MPLSFAPERIEQWPLTRLQPYAKNAKTHGADQVAKIAASMAEFGWTVPCLVAEDGELIAGHGRVLAATQLGLTADAGAFLALSADPTVLKSAAATGT
jgi:ParB-like chromosome segregation protein Spo0J